MDPYYVTHKAQQIGYHPDVILAGHRINDDMGGHVAKLMARRNLQTAQPRILILGLALEENCPDVRNTRVVDILAELRNCNANADFHDPWVSASEAKEEYGVALVEQPEAGEYDAVILAVSHREFIALGSEGIRAFGKPDAVVFDVKQALPRNSVDDCL